MRISDWSSDVCSSDLLVDVEGDAKAGTLAERDGCPASQPAHVEAQVGVVQHQTVGAGFEAGLQHQAAQTLGRHRFDITAEPRSEEHTSELQSLMRISYDVFCLKKKKH